MVSIGATYTSGMPPGAQVDTTLPAAVVAPQGPTKVVTVEPPLGIGRGDLAPPATLAPPQQMGVRANAIGACGPMRTFNPLCWSVADLSRQRTLDTALAEGQRRGLDKLIWRGKRYVLKAPVRSSGLAPQAQLDSNGVTDAQYNLAYVPGLSDRLFNQVTPLGYGHRFAALHAYQGRDDGNRDALLSGRAPAGFEDYFHGVSPNARLDAWALYLGMPQRHGTFRLSQFRPANGTAGEYFALTDAATLDTIVKYATTVRPYGPSRLGERDDNARDVLAPRLYSVFTADDMPDSDFKGNRVLGHFTMERHRDARGHYISYSYTWRLTPLQPFSYGEASELTGVGHPFEVYDRIYYDPATGKRL